MWCGGAGCPYAHPRWEIHKVGCADTQDTRVFDPRANTQQIHSQIHCDTCTPGAGQGYVSRMLQSSSIKKSQYRSWRLAWTTESMMQKSKDFAQKRPFNAEIGACGGRQGRLRRGRAPGGCKSDRWRQQIHRNTRVFKPTPNTQNTDLPSTIGTVTRAMSLVAIFVGGDQTP